MRTAILLASGVLAACATAQEATRPERIIDPRVAQRLDAGLDEPGFGPRGFGRAGQPEFAILYDEVYREIHIYGKPDFDNQATAILIAGGPSITDPPIVRVNLVSTDEGTGGPLTLSKDVALFSPFKQQDPGGSDPDEDIAPLPGGPSPVPPPGPGSIPRVVKIWFHGGAEVDTYSNETDIPSAMAGSFGDDVLIGGGVTDDLHGQGGADTLRGRGGGDFLYGGSGDDTLEGDEGDDEIYTGEGNDDAFGGPGNDLLKAVSAGNNADVNRLCGQDGADWLEGAGLAGLNRLDAQLAGSNDDGDVDTLRGFSGPANFDEFDFTPGSDLIVVNDEQLFPGDDNFPVSQEVPCS